MTAFPKTEITEASFPTLEDEAPGVTLTDTPLSSIGEIPVKVTAVLGKTRIDIATLQKMNDGAIIELDRKVGEPIDIYVNDRLIARGELVIADGSIGVMLTDVVAPTDLGNALKSATSEVPEVKTQGRS